MLQTKIDQEIVIQMFLIQIVWSRILTDLEIFEFRNILDPKITLARKYFRFQKKFLLESSK